MKNGCCNLPPVDTDYNSSYRDSSFDYINVETKNDEFCIWYEVTYKYRFSNEITERTLDLEDFFKKIHYYPK